MMIVKTGPDWIERDMSPYLPYLTVIFHQVQGNEI